MSDEKRLPVDPIELVAIDLDGTLLRSNGKICPKSINTIATARARGVRIVLASGRPPRSMKRVYRRLELDTLQISHDGALIHFGRMDRPWYHQPMPGHVAHRVIGLALALDSPVHVGLEVLDTGYTTTTDRRIRTEAAAGPQARQSRTLEPYLNGPVTKILLVGEPAALGGMHAALAAQLPDQVAFTFSHMGLLQVVHASVDKGTALAQVADYYGVPRSGVMAIGDAPNDLGMLGWAGLGAAVQNCWADVRQAAQFIVPSNDRAGVAYALQKYVLMG